MKIREFLNLKTLPYILLDVLLINAAAFFALFARFEFSFATVIEEGYWSVIQKIWIPGTLVCIASFIGFRIYSSMWRFASMRELVNTGLASVIGSALYMMVVLVFGEYLPRSFFFLFALILFLRAPKKAVWAFVPLTLSLLALLLACRGGRFLPQLLAALVSMALFAPLYKVTVPSREIM